ncbi:glycosyl transferase [Actinorhabdospora filicis]|uniref:Glycosyl transferase n=1 Tax=Actinorhabdospora filicis TaxID=1785913 RepID=A0A9W6SIF1_9ACTN|nr:hypothetical protein [Actinorhabdospora filicis]GLZ76412.1 glycosyl transferase [Actinorhabdospora filicis]
MAEIPREAPVPQDPPIPPETPVPRWRRRVRTRVATDLAAAAAFLGLAVYIGHQLLAAPNGRLLTANWTDQVLIEWFLGYGGRFWIGDFSLVTDRLNSPDGVNLMANASHIGHAVLLAPITWIWGAPVTFAVALAGNLAATAFCWYLLFSRELVSSRLAAFTGALFCGFAPGMLSQSQSHLHISAGWLAPLLIWCLIKVWRGRRPVRWGALLGVLSAAQLFVGEEVLYLSVLGAVIFALVWVLGHLRELKGRLVNLGLGLTTAAFVGLALVAYPLMVQFTGAQHLNNAPFAAEYFSSDVVSWTTFSQLTIGGHDDVSKLAPGHTEQNTFLGPAVIVVTVIAIGCLWFSRKVVRALAAVILVMFLLSIGPQVLFNGEPTRIWGPYELIGWMPVVDAALPTRYALALIPAVGAVLALAVDAARPRGILTAIRLRLSGMPKGQNLIVRTSVLLIVLAALIPLTPRALPAMERPPVPEFITSGAWRECAPEGGVIVPVPPPTPGNPNTMRWATAANGAFGTPEGFFLGPYGADGATSMGTWSRPTATMWRKVWEGEDVPEVNEETRAQARKDILEWKADCVVVPTDYRVPQMVELTTRLLGPGQQVMDVWVWKVSDAPVG